MARSMKDIVRDERGASAGKVLGIIFGVINAIIGTLMTIAGIAMGIEEESIALGLLLCVIMMSQAIGGFMLIYCASRLDKQEPKKLPGRAGKQDVTVVSRTQVAGPRPDGTPAPAPLPATMPAQASAPTAAPAPTPVPAANVPTTPAATPATAPAASAAPDYDSSETDDVTNLVIRSENLFATLQDLMHHDEVARAHDQASDHRHLASMLNAAGISSWRDAPVCEAGRLTRNHHFWIRYNVDSLSDEDYDRLICAEAALSLNQDLPEARKLSCSDSATVLATNSLLRMMPTQTIDAPDLSQSLGAAYPDRDASATPGEWFVRASLVSAAECAITPFRVVYDLRVNVAKGVVVLSLELPRPKCMTIYAPKEDLVPAARAYALRLAFLLARQALDIDHRITRVVVNGHERGSDTTILSIDFSAQLIDRLEPTVVGEAIEGTGFPSDPSIRVSFDRHGWFSEVEPFLAPDDPLVSPRERFVYPELNKQAASERLATVTGAHTISDLGINENAPRIAAWDALAAEPMTTTEAAVSRLVALRDSSPDITVVEACARTMQALVSGSVDAADTDAMQRIFIAGSALEQAVSRAEAALAEDGKEDPEAALAALREALGPIEALGPYIDDETTVYRYFGSIAERIRFNLDVHDQKREVRLVPDAYYNALSNASIAYGMLGNEQEAMRYAEEMMRIAPTSIHAGLRKVRVLENSSRVFEAADLIRSMLRFASTPRDAAVCHYRLAFMEWKLGREDLGVACYQRSLSWDTEMSAQAREELSDLLESNDQLHRMSDDEVNALLAKEGIPLGCDTTDKRQLAAAATLCCDEGVFWAARPLVGILFGIDSDDVMMGIYRSLAAPTL